MLSYASSAFSSTKQVQLVTLIWLRYPYSILTWTTESILIWTSYKLNQISCHCNCKHISAAVTAIVFTKWLLAWKKKLHIYRIWGKNTQYTSSKKKATTGKHLQQECPVYEDERKFICSLWIPFYDKFYKNKEDPERTTVNTEHSNWCQKVCRKEKQIQVQLCRLRFLMIKKRRRNCCLYIALCKCQIHDYTIINEVGRTCCAITVNYGSSLHKLTSLLHMLIFRFIKCLLQFWDNIHILIKKPCIFPQSTRSF